MRQASYRYLDPKFETFSRLFSKTIISFPSLRLSNSSSIQTLKEAGTKLFSRCTANVWAKLDKIWPKRKKFNYKALVVALKKTPDFLPFLQDFISGKLLGKFQDLPRHVSLSCAKEGGKETTGRLYPSHGPLRLITSRSPLPCEKQSAWGGGCFKTFFKNSRLCTNPDKTDIL